MLTVTCKVIKNVYPYLPRNKFDIENEEKYKKSFTNFNGNERCYS